MTPPAPGPIGWPGVGSAVVAIAVLTAALLVADLLYPAAIPGAPYVGLVAAALWLPWRAAPLYLAAILSLLLVLGYVLAPPYSELGIVLANATLTLIGIWIVAWLSYRFKIEALHAATNADRLHALFEASVDPAIMIDAAGHILTFNPAAQHVFGYAADEIVGKNVSVLMPSPYREQHDSYMQTYLRTGQRKIIGVGREVTGLRKDGSAFPLRLAVAEAETRGERYFVGTIQDLTEQKAHERALRESEARLAAIVDSAVDPIIVIDERGVVEAFNRAGEAVLGFTADEVIGNNVSMLMPSPDREQHDGYLSNYMTTGKARIIGIGREVMAQHKAGHLVPVRVAIAEATAGGKRRFVGMLHDLTQQKAAEKELAEVQSQLYRASRLGDLGEMATAIAHELNQPLTAVLNYVQTSRDVLSSSGANVPPKVLEFMDKAGTQADRAGKIIRRLRQLYERGESEMVLTDLNALVRESLALALLGAKERGVTVALDLADGLPQAAIDRVQIQQVIFNLARNAIEALERCERRELRISTHRAGTDVEVAVEDTGPGLPEEISRNLFNPFHTTKATGMGLGLSICRSIVESHGGRITATSRPGEGTRFVFTLPLDDQEQSIDA